MLRSDKHLRLEKRNVWKNRLNLQQRIRKEYA